MLKEIITKLSDIAVEYSDLSNEVGGIRADLMVNAERNLLEGFKYDGNITLRSNVFGCIKHLKNKINELKKQIEIRDAVRGE